MVNIKILSLDKPGCGNRQECYWRIMIINRFIVAVTVRFIHDQPWDKTTYRST